MEQHRHTSSKKGRQREQDKVPTSCLNAIPIWQLGRLATDYYTCLRPKHSLSAASDFVRAQLIPNMLFVFKHPNSIMSTQDTSENDRKCIKNPFAAPT